VLTDLSGRIAGIVDGGESAGVGVESTVVECADADPSAGRHEGCVTILRPGGITREQLEAVVGVGRVRMDPAIVRQQTAMLAHPADASTQSSAICHVQALPKQHGIRGKEQPTMSSLTASAAAPALPTPPPATASSHSSSGDVPNSAISAGTASAASSDAAAAVAASTANVTLAAPRAPGMKYTHYAPRAPLVLIDGSLSFLLAVALPYVRRDEVVGVMATAEAAADIAAWRAANDVDATLVQHLVCGSTRSDLPSVARGLYSALRAADDSSVQIILSEVFDARDMGEAVMNRLNKAAGGRIIREAPVPFA
jgi:hypothetical protein